MESIVAIALVTLYSTSTDELKVFLISPTLRSICTDLMFEGCRQVRLILVTE